MFKIIGETKDIKSGATVIYCQCSPEVYLEIVGDNFGNFSIQRKRETHKAYKRLRADILEGALLPSITLSIKHHLVSEIIKLKDESKKLYEKLCTGESVDILDGLQRTYILSDINNEGLEFKKGQSLLLELWLEEDLSKLIYRMIVLNSGQKAMSMRHQIDLLFMSLKETIVNDVKGIEIIMERDQKRRTQSNKYALSNLASAYQAFITRSPETDKENLVAQQLVEDNAFDSSEDELNKKYNNFIEYLKIFVELDALCWKKYDQIDNKKYEEMCQSENLSYNDESLDILRESSGWLGSENTMLSFFGTVSSFIELDRKNRIDAALNRLIESVKNPEIVDPLGMINYNKIRLGLNPRKVNIGFATRKMISNGLKEFFRESGEVDLKNCWSQAVE